MPALPDQAILGAMADLLCKERDARDIALKSIAADLAHLRERIDAIDATDDTNIVPPELAEQIARAVRVLHEAPLIIEPKAPPPPKVIRIERDANGSMVPIYSAP